MWKRIIFFIGFLFINSIMIYSQPPNNYWRLVTEHKAVPVLDLGEDLLLPPGQDSIQPIVTSDDPGNYDYLWNGPDGYSSTVVDPWLSILGDYNLMVTNIYGCTAIDDLSLRMINPTDTVWTINPLPKMCKGEGSIMLDQFVNMPSTGTFSGINVSNRRFNPIVAGVFEIIWTVDNLEVVNTVQVLDLPDVHVHQDEIIWCQGEEVSLAAIGDADYYHWYLLGSSEILSTEQYYSVEIDGPKHYLLEAGKTVDDKQCVIEDTSYVAPVSADFDISQYVDQEQHLYGSFVRAKPKYRLGDTYHWEFGDIYGSSTNTSYEVVGIHNYEHKGLFNVSLQMTSVCGDFTATKEVYVNYFTTSTFIAENDAVDIKLYPNPVVDFIYLDFGDANVSLLQIFDLTGKLVSSVPVYQLTYQIDATGFQSGTYIVKMFDKQNRVISAKFMKQ